MKLTKEIRLTFMTVVLLILGALVLTLPEAQGASLKSPHCFDYCPEAVQENGNTVVHHHDYTLSNNPASKLADWVAYAVNPKNFGPSRKRNWKADPSLPENETLEPADYVGANVILKTDRGHQAPLASFAGSKFWHELNYLSNITPQKAKLNQGAWKRLEAKVREASITIRKSYYVMTGPLVSDAEPKLPGADEPMQTPYAYWKVIVVKHNGTLYATGFLMPQTMERAEDFCDKEVPIELIEEMAGLSFHLIVYKHLGSLCGAVWV